MRALLFVTVRNMATNAIRNFATRTTLLAARDAPTPSSAPDRLIHAQHLDQRLRTWIEELPERRREAFELSRFAGLTYGEIARVMDLSPKTVEKHLTRALQHLRDRLRAYDPDLLHP